MLKGEYKDKLTDKDKPLFDIRH